MDTVCCFIIYKIKMGEGKSGMLTYIRHIYDGKREASDKPDVFSPISEPHQDVVRYSCMQGDNAIIYTWGKQLFPKNYELTNSPQRWTVICMIEGELFCGKEQLFAGDFSIIPSSCSHTLRSRNEDVKFYWCTTNDEHLIHILSICGYGGQEIMKGHTQRVKPIVEVFENTLYHFPGDCDQRVYFMSAYTALFSFLSNVKNDEQMQKVSEQLFSRCLSHIEHAYGNVSVDYLAKRYFISRRYLYAMFKEYKNISPIDYILSVRMKAADKFLSTTDLSVSRIADLTGYSDYNHFTRAYKKYFGMLPSKRRKLIRTQIAPNTDAGDREADDGEKTE